VQTAAGPLPVSVRPTFLLGLAAFVLVLTLREITGNTGAWLWTSNLRLVVMLVAALAARLGGERLSVRAASVVLVVSVGAAVVLLR
jgi:hypothetical protein